MMRTFTQHLRHISLGLAFAFVLLANPARADEGGVSFWAPGQFGSLAAVPSEPGWSLPLSYYHAFADADASKNFIRGGKLTAGINATADLVFAFPTYTFAQPVLGGQAAISMGWAVGRTKGEAAIGVAGPRGNTFGSSQSDTASGGSDIYGLGTLKWNDGNNNFIAYGMFGIP